MSGIILVSVAVLLLLGWRLGILESVVVTLAIGLAVDFTLHYGVMYKLAGLGERADSVRYSVAAMGSPVSMAALTSLAAGLCLLPARVLAYTQIGTFIIVLMLVSWILSTFFFQSLLAAWGPTSPTSVSRLCCSVEEEEEEDELDTMKKAFTVSDTLQSTVWPLEPGLGEHQSNGLAENGECGLEEGAGLEAGARQRRSQSCSRQMGAGGRDWALVRRQSADCLDQTLARLDSMDCQAQSSSQSRSQARLNHSTGSPCQTRPECRTPGRSPRRARQVEPGPPTVSDGRTIRCDPLHASLGRPTRSPRETRAARRQTLPCTQLNLTQQETFTHKTPTTTQQTQTPDPGTGQSHHVDLRTQISADTQTSPPSILTNNNGAIPKHSRKKSLPESAFVVQQEQNFTPYEILPSPPRYLCTDL